MYNRQIYRLENSPPHPTSALSKFRLDYSFPYQNIGLDYAGLIYFKNCDHTEKMVKGYFLIIHVTVHVQFISN